MVELIDKADLTASQGRSRTILHADRSCARDIYLARIGPFQKTRDMEKRRFTGTGWSDKRDGLSGPHTKIRSPQNFERRACLIVAAFDLFETKRRRRHDYS